MTHLLKLLAAAPLTLALSCSSSGDDDSAAGAGGAAGGSPSGGQTNGGTHASGGAAGSGGTLAAGGAAGGSADCGCMNTTVSWHRDGGFTSYTEISTLAPCTQYTLVREPFGDGPTLMCTQELAVGCTNSLGAADVRALLASADVQAAIAAAPVLYGEDPRAYDGQLLHIDVGDAVIEVGDACGSAAGCTAIPAGVQALAELLGELAAQEREREPCASAIP